MRCTGAPRKSHLLRGGETHGWSCCEQMCGFFFFSPLAQTITVDLIVCWTNWRSVPKFCARMIRSRPQTTRKISQVDFVKLSIWWPLLHILSRTVLALSLAVTLQTTSKLPYTLLGAVRFSCWHPHFTTVSQISHSYRDCHGKYLHNFNISPYIQRHPCFLIVSWPLAFCPRWTNMWQKCKCSSTAWLATPSWHQWGN